MIKLLLCLSLTTPVLLYERHQEEVFQSLDTNPDLEWVWNELKRMKEEWLEEHN